MFELLPGVLIRSWWAGQLLWSGMFVDPEGEVDGSVERGGYGRVCGDEGGRSAVAGSLARKGATEREVRGKATDLAKERGGDSGLFWQRRPDDEGEEDGALVWREGQLSLG